MCDLRRSETTESFTDIAGHTAGRVAQLISEFEIPSRGLAAVDEAVHLTLELQGQLVRVQIFETTHPHLDSTGNRNANRFASFVEWIESMLQDLQTVRPRTYGVCALRVAPGRHRRTPEDPEDLKDLRKPGDLESVVQLVIRTSPQAGYEALGNVLRIFPIAWQFRCEHAIF